MSFAETLRNATASIAATHEKMEADTKDAKRRFFAFVDTHNVPLGYVDYPWSPNQPANILEDVDSFYLCTGYNNKDGLTFAHDIYDGTESVTIPYEYFDDADTWESITLAEIAADLNTAENFVATLPASGGYTVESIRLDGGYGETFASISIEIGTTNRTDDFYGINDFVSLSRLTGEVVHISANLKKELAKSGMVINL